MSDFVSSLDSSASSSLSLLEHEITKVQKEIKLVEVEIKTTEVELKNCPAEEKQDCRDKLQRLGEEKKQLRKKEEQLREEKNLLLQQQLSFGKAASVSPSPIWVHCSIVPPGRRKDMPPIPLPLATISMKQLCDYAQQQFEFPEANFTITPAVDRTRREEEENVTSKLLLIQSDEQLRHHLSTLQPNEHHLIDFRFSVRLEQKQFSDWRWNQISKSFKLSENLISHIDTEANKLVIQPMNTNNERLQHIVKHTAERLIAERAVLPALDISTEAVASEYVSAVITAICLYFFDDYQMRKLPQLELFGQYGRGPADFVVHAEGVEVCVTEVKRHGSLEQGIAQNIAQMEATLSANNRKRKREPDSDSLRLPNYSLGIVSNAASWYMQKLSVTEEKGEEKPIVQIAHLNSLPLQDDCGRPSCLPAPSSLSSSSCSLSSSSQLSSLSPLHAALNKLLSFLLPPIQEAIHLSKAKRSKNS